jgi:hypothetical protein
MVLRLARMIRCETVLSGTRNAAAICAVVRPQIVRRVSAICASPSMRSVRYRCSSTRLSWCRARRVDGYCTPELAAALYTNAGGDEESSGWTNTSKSTSTTGDRRSPTLSKPRPSAVSAVAVGSWRTDDFGAAAQSSCARPVPKGDRR